MNKDTPDFRDMPETDLHDLAKLPDDHDDEATLKREHWQHSTIKPARHSHVQQRPECASAGLTQVSETAKRASHHMLLSLSTEHSTDILCDAYLLPSSKPLPEGRSSEAADRVQHVRESVAKLLEGLEAIATVPYHSDKRMHVVRVRFSELGHEFMDLTGKMTAAPSPDKEIYTGLRDGIAHIRQVGFEFGIEEALKKRSTPAEFQKL